MSEVLKLEANARDGVGKGVSRALRREGRIPAIIYGGKEKGETKISLPFKEVFVEYNKGHFTSKLVDLEIGKETLRVLPREVQIHPVTDAPLHVDFIRLEKGAKVNVFVQVVFINKDTCPGIRRGGVLNIVRRDIELVCDVDAIPQKLVVDLNGRAIGDSIHLSHIKLPEGVVPVINDRDFTVATIVGRTAKEDTAATEESAEGDVEAEGAETEEATEE
ncbi:50S ribosomal protein L25/general stress protein Ctc [Rickettsiales bacterium]|nr:50S ribosomal protein L25/general stress protein Ctc [Rickettsiales bacterium]